MCEAAWLRQRFNCMSRWLSGQIVLCRRRVRNAAASSFRAFSAALSILKESNTLRLNVSVPVRTARAHPRRMSSISDPMWPVLRS